MQSIKILLWDFSILITISIDQTRTCTVTDIGKSDLFHKLDVLCCVELLHFHTTLTLLCYFAENLLNCTVHSIHELTASIGKMSGNKFVIVLWQNTSNAVTKDFQHSVLWDMVEPVNGGYLWFHSDLTNLTKWSTCRKYYVLNPLNGVIHQLSWCEVKRSISTYEFNKIVN
jgi:hypothetical protein